MITPNHRVGSCVLGRQHSKGEGEEGLRSGEDRLLDPEEVFKVSLSSRIVRRDGP